MRLLVIGSSDTSGTSLPDPSKAWPKLVAAELGAVIGEPIEVVNLPMVYVGPKVVPRVEGALQQNEPDLVVFAFGAYNFIVATVGLRVRRRYGERAYRWFRKVELRFEGATANAEGRRARINRLGRRVTRRIIGAEPLGTREEVVGNQLEVMRLLSQRERMPVVVLYAPPLGEAIEQENRGANAILAEQRTFMNGEARQRHFLVADCLPGFAEEAKQQVLRHSDGVHKSARGHRIQADAVMLALRTSPSPFAAAAS